MASPPTGRSGQAGAAGNEQQPMLRTLLATSGLRPTAALFCDRDGVLNRRNPDGYITRPEDLVVLATALDAAVAAQARGVPVVVVSNQGAIGRGLASPAEVEAVNDRLVAELAQRGLQVAGIFVCPHHPHALRPADRDCDCRKPRPGLLRQAALDLHLDLARSVLIGDQPSDLGAATAAGLAPHRQVLVGEDDDPSVVAGRVAAAFDSP